MISVYLSAGRSRREEIARYAELGWALADQQRVILVGQPEHAFHRLGHIEQHDTWERLLEQLPSPNAATGDDDEAPF